MRFLTVVEVARLLRVPRSRAYELVRAGSIPAVRLGERQIRVEEGALREWVVGGGSASAVVESHAHAKPIESSR